MRLKYPEHRSFSCLLDDLGLPGIVVIKYVFCAGFGVMKDFGFVDCLYHFEYSSDILAIVILHPL